MHGHAASGRHAPEVSICLQLMGKERNKPLAEREDKPLRYYDREVCKYNLCGLCPNMLFTNTKSYLGEWTGVVICSDLASCSRSCMQLRVQQTYR
jgi:LUC7 N_terminus